MHVVHLIKQYAGLSSAFICSVILQQGLQDNAFSGAAHVFHMHVCMSCVYATHPDATWACLQHGFLVMQHAPKFSSSRNDLRVYDVHKFGAVCNNSLC